MESGPFPIVLPRVLPHILPQNISRTFPEINPLIQFALSSLGILKARKLDKSLILVNKYITIHADL